MNRAATVTERWRAIPGWCRYQASNLGRIRSTPAFIFSPTGGTGRRLHIGGILKQTKYSRFKCEYTRVGLHNGKKKKSVVRFVHVLILEAFVGKRPKGEVCRHLNGDGLDNRLKNLRWGTRKENERDKRRHGRAMLGERHHAAKLSDEDVRTIRSSKLHSGIEGAAFGVHPSNIRQIRARKTWRHI